MPSLPIGNKIKKENGSSDTLRNDDLDWRPGDLKKAPFDSYKLLSLKRQQYIKNALTKIINAACR